MTSTAPRFASYSCPDRDRASAEALATAFETKHPEFSLVPVTFYQDAAVDNKVISWEIRRNGKKVLLYWEVPSLRRVLKDAAVPTTADNPYVLVLDRASRLRSRLLLDDAAGVMDLNADELLWALNDSGLCETDTHVAVFPRSVRRLAAF